MRFLPHATDRQMALALIVLGGCSLIDLFIPNLFSLEISPSFFFASVGVAIALPIDLAYLAMFAPIFLIRVPLSISLATYTAPSLAAFTISFFFIRKHLTPGSYLAAFVSGLFLSLISTLLLLIVGFFGGETVLTANNIFIALLNGILTGILAYFIRGFLYFTAHM